MKDYIIIYGEDLILEDAIRDLADGVDYEFIKFKENNI